MHDHITGDNNVAVGIDAFQMGTTFSNGTAIGMRAAAYNNADEIIAIGHAAMENGTTGLRNTVIGAYARREQQTGNDDTIVGYGTMSGTAISNSGGDNTFMGSNAG